MTHQRIRSVAGIFQEAPTHGTSKTTTMNIVAATAAVFLSLGCAATTASETSTAAPVHDVSNRNHPNQGKNMNQEIQTLLQTYQRSLNEANVELVRSVYADDAVFIGQPFPTATGRDEIVALYEDFLSKLDFDVEFEILEVELGEDIGFVRTKSRGTIVPKGQPPQEPEGNREVFVVKKFNGAWKFYRYIFNPEV